MDNFDKLNENIIKVMKILRWPLEFIAIILGGYMFVWLMDLIIGSYGGSYGPILAEMGWFILYVAGVIWLAALRIVRAIKNKNAPKDPPQ